MAFSKKALSAISSWSIWSNYRFSFLQLCTSVMPFWFCVYDETNKLRLIISNFFCGGADNKRSRTIILCISRVKILCRTCNIRTIFDGLSKAIRPVPIGTPRSFGLDRHFIVTSPNSRNREWCIGVTMATPCQWRYASWANRFWRHLSAGKDGTWSEGRASARRIWKKLKKKQM